MRRLIALSLAILGMSAIATTEAQVAVKRETLLPPAVARALSDGARAELLLIFGPRDESGDKRQDAFFPNEMPFAQVRTFETDQLGAPGAQVWIAFSTGIDH